MPLLIIVKSDLVRGPAAQVCGQQYVLENQATEDKLALLVL